ncbi:MAG: hypothetical protein BRC58_04150 [Cyanobacteria bacterium QS_8_64_29]|nr:MAG: hypothetical protein BRC58_04150 [Cyanobacteria bacterium QS_8_64_29]
MADTLGDTIINVWIIGLLDGGEPSQYRSLLKQRIERLVPTFEAKLGQTRYLLGGESWSMADIAALCSFGYYDLRLGPAWQDRYPYLRDWFERLHQIDSVKATIPTSSLN